jgi:glutamate decarboxylase
MKAAGKPCDKPNIVTGANVQVSKLQSSSVCIDRVLQCFKGQVFHLPPTHQCTWRKMQVCWEKFARYFEVELKEVKLSDGYYVMDPQKAVDMVDENTICVAAILGSTLNGEFEDVKLLNDLLAKKNAETG